MGKACKNPAVWCIHHPTKNTYACVEHLDELRGSKLPFAKKPEPGTGIVCDWEGSMSERKADYYAQHLADQIVGQVKDTVETIQPVGLPTLLARMVNEFRAHLDQGYISNIDVLTEQFTATLLASAQPLLAEYLTKLTNPPYVVKSFYQSQTEDENAAWQAREMAEWDKINQKIENPEPSDGKAGLTIMVRAVLAAERQQEKFNTPEERKRQSMYGAYLLKCKERDLVPFDYDEWCNIGDGPKTKGAK